MSENKKTIIITGGAGYIGSHMVLEMANSKWTPVIVDNFGRGNRDLAEKLGVEICEGDTADHQFLDQVFKTHKPSAVMHFAALAYVGESVTDPSLYYSNNVTGTLHLLQAMLRHDVKRMIFSSTCATYGTPEIVPIAENCPQAPVNPYGHTKLMIEQMLRDFETAYGLKSIVFRYFNAAGADPAGLIGERHEPESHLVPLAAAAALGHTSLKVFGDDYDTPDGTCVRDYIHILDIADAHLKGLDYLMAEDTSDAFNIGNGNGYSVLEVLKAVEEVSGKPVPYEMAGRRAGDPPRLVAAAEKIARVLGWKPRYPELKYIVKTAWDWYLKDKG